MITHMQFLEARECGDNKLIEDYAMQMVDASQYTLSQLQKCGFTDNEGHGVMNNMAVQQLANMAYLQTHEKDKRLRG